MARRRRSGMALYCAILATTLIVSLLAMSAMSIVRIERKQQVTIGDRMMARSHARSAVELALSQLNASSTWRSVYTHNVETAPLTMGPNSKGTISWKLVDSDGSLTNADQLLRLKGIGRVGSTVQVNSVEVRAGSVGPTALRSYTNILSSSNDDVKNNKWWGQYFKPTLPADANGWRISSVDFYCQRKNGNETINVRLYKTSLDGVNLIDSVTLSSSGFPGIWGWYTINFGGAYWLNSNETAVVTLETSNANPIEIRYRGGGVSEANSAMVRGNPNWNSYEPDKALMYRINGHYTNSGSVSPVAGSWQWDGP